MTAIPSDPSLAGRLLLALPGMPDPRFARSVIAMVVHEESGALGIGIGRHADGITLHQLLADLEIEPGETPDSPVLLGGPVETQRGFVLHTADWSCEGTLSAGPLGALTTSIDVLRAIAAGTGPSRYLVALGYAGWGAGQLDAEMQRHGWHAATGRPEVLFETPAETRWAAAWRAEGVDPALLSETSGHA